MAVAVAVAAAVAGETKEYKENGRDTRQRILSPLIMQRGRREGAVPFISKWQAEIVCPWTAAGPNYYTKKTLSPARGQPNPRHSGISKCG